ncbi:MAG: response regulator [Nitrospira sp.]|nr:response regulator [Nitrospira sp.]
MPKILVADDSIAVRKVAERLLIEAGLGVALAANGEEAMAYLTKDRADVVVSDVIMPDKSGYEVCAFVRNNSALASIPVLLISGIVNDEVTKQAEACRADGVLKKPFQGTSLKDKVLELLGKRQSQSAASPATPASPPNQPQASAVMEGGKPFSLAPSSQATTPGAAALPGARMEADRPSAAVGAVDAQLSNKLKEVEGQLRGEQARTESLAKRVLELESEISRAKESEALLEAERSRISDLEAKVSSADLQLLRIPQLEASLREEQEAAEKARQEAGAMRNASDSIAQLEATLDAERATAAQLVNQISDLEAAAARGKNSEAMLAREMERTNEYMEKSANAEAALASEKRKIAELEVELKAERKKWTDSELQLQAANSASAKVQELEALLSTERDRNAVLARRVSETEQVAVNATKRFEEMARKLGEIASLASQLGKGTGES